MSAKVSIIMGIYNCSATLSQAIDSILNQTFTEWKLIMCDDGSVDDTALVAQSYVDKYPDKIILIKNEKNMGLNYTLNHCLEYADTEYVARMDGDDISLPERLEKEFNFLESHPQYAIVSTPMIYFDENGDFGMGNNEGEPQVDSFVRGTPFCHAPCMVRREAYTAISGYSVSDKRLRVEDWDVWVRMYAQGYKGYVYGEPLYKMRDDRNAFARRKFKYRFNEVRVIAYAVKALKLSKINYIWIFRPIIAGLVPKFVYEFVHKRNLK